MNPTSFATVAALLLTSSLTGVFLQPSPQTGKGSPRIKSDKRSDADPEKATASELISRRLLAIDLIKSAGEEAVRIDNRKSAAQIQLLAAEALAPHDKDFAVGLFRRAFDSALAWYRSVNDQTRDPVTRLTTVSPEDFCRDVIRRMSAFDAGLGRSAANTLDEETRRKGAGRQNLTEPTVDESVIHRSAAGSPALANELMKARGMLRRNQQAAIEIARTIFARETAWHSIQFIWELALLDRDAADQFFLLQLADMLENKAASPGRLLVLANYPFCEEIILLTNGFGYQWVQIYSAERLSKARDPDSERLLIDWYIEVSFAVLSRIAAEDLSTYPDAASRLGAAFYLSRWLEPRVASSRPALLPAWRQIIDRLSPRLLPDQAALIAGLPEQEARLLETYHQKSNTAPEDPVERIKRLLESAGNEQDSARSDYFYQQAAIEADRIGNHPRALEIADKITSLEYRRQTRDWIYFNASSSALKEERIEAARRDAAQVFAPDQRASLYCAIARAALSDKDSIGAALLLDEAETRTIDADNSPAKVRSLVLIAKLFDRFDSFRALQVVSLAVRTANNTPDYEPDDAKLVRSLKHAAGSKYGLVHEAEKADLDAAIASIAPSDFEGALRLAQSIANKTLRLSATISVAVSALQANTDSKDKNVKPK